MNIYYSPEKFGLRVVGAMNLADSYEFNMFVVWRDDRGRLYWGTDSGCSCPSPFEDRGLDSLTRATRTQIQRAASAWVASSCYIPKGTEVTDLMASIIREENSNG